MCWEGRFQGLHRHTNSRLFTLDLPALLGTDPESEEKPQPVVCCRVGNDVEESRGIGNLKLHYLLNWHDCFSALTCLPPRESLLELGAGITGCGRGRLEEKVSVIIWR